jgi:two-component system, NarL family, nitrate/nitrite response regulator NarL
MDDVGRGHTKIRVLIADDHPPTRQDVREALEQDARFEVCAEAKDAPAALTAAAETRPDICLLDVRMPGSGIAAAWEIKARLPDTKVVMLTVSTDDEDLFAALRAGASGYLLKDVDPPHLAEALQDVVQGEPAIPPSLVGRIIEEFRDRGPRHRRITTGGPGGQLTSREWQVLDLMRNGQTTAEMARSLFLSQATVRSHVAAILRKLRVPDRESAIRLFDETSG